jgi:hypothetical protein
MIKNNRDLTIDFIRGVLLLVMILDHCFFFLFPDLNGQKITFEFIGYCSAAEGFFFLAGFSMAKVYLPKTYSLGTDFVKKKIFGKAFNIYLIHLGLILLTLVIRPYFYHDSSFDNLYLHSLKEAFLAIIFFYQPTLLDILPIYTVFFLMTPFLLQKIADKKTKFIIILSFGIWILGQINPYGRAYHGVLFSFFDLFSWQLVYVLGIISSQIVLPTETKGKLLLVCSSIIVIAGFLARHFIGFKYQNMHWLLARNTMGFLRLINVMAIFYIICRARPLISKILHFSLSKIIILIGQNSLKVFVWHLIAMIFISHWLNQYHSLTKNIEICDVCLVTVVMILPIFYSSFKSQLIRKMKSLNNYQ